MTLLKVSNLTIQFGGLRAIDDLSFSINPGTIHSIIGPNGAGKTTLFNLITGVYTPTSGTVLYDDEGVTGFKPYELAARGMSRTFQNLQIFFNMTAIENVMVGSHLHLNRNFFASFFGMPQIRNGDRHCRETCLELLDFVGLKDYADTDTESMPYGALKRLEIARALASKPKILLLDEPAAGLNPAESRAIDNVIKKVAERGVTVVLVEHDMKMVMEISDHILVLDYGRKLTEGSALEVRNNPDVIAAYLGG